MIEIKDFYDPQKLRAMALTANAALGGVIGTGRVHLEHAINHLNALAAVFETHIRKAAEAQALKSAGVRRQPELPIAHRMAAAAAEDAAKVRKNKKDKPDTE
jgi:predicted aspartyl protease